MNDPILKARLDALEANLKRHENPPLWQKQFGLNELANVQLEQVVWIEFSMEILNRVADQLSAVKKIRDCEDLQQAWQGYRNVYAQSQEIFCDCLEFLGALAFRDKKWDESICQIGDELIGRCAEASGQKPSMIILVSREAIKKSLGRIIRLRLQEWTIWTLPCTAHEYGHVIEDEVTALKSFVGEEAILWVKDDLKAQQPRDGAGDQQAAEAALKLVEAAKNATVLAEQAKLFENAGGDQLTAQFVNQALQLAGKYECHIQELIADAFATYTMGPAYAYAAVLLRLNPADATGTNDEPGDARRARVIFEMLIKMNQTVAGAKVDAPPYSNIIEELEKQWEAAAIDKLEPIDNDRLKILVDRIWDKFYQVIYSAAKYPVDSSEDGWQIALEWSQKWIDSLKQKAELPIPRVSVISKVRDVLNAAWLCRREYPDEIERITKAAYALCGDIIAKRLHKPTRESAQAQAGGFGPSPSTISTKREQGR
ncbi:MAG TPA: hypothetical protein VK747_19510 [Blastocatellia bacterium]|nr:hypothetical protein [Blastocatellia bacterium]